MTQVGTSNDYYTMLTTSNYASYISAGWMSYTGSSTGSATLKIDPATDESISGSSATYGKVKNNGSRYMEFYVTGISSIKFYFANTGSTDRKIQYILNSGSATDLVTVVQKTSNSGAVSLSSSSNNTIRIFSPDNDVCVCAVKVTVDAGASPCTDATVSFAATSDAIEIGSGESSASTSLTFSSDNASTASYAVTKGGAATADASVTGTTFTATAAGEYVVTVTQAKDETNNICAVEETVTITVADANIVLPGATLTAHTPGTYESPTGYNVALTEYNEREYETYFFSYSSSKVYLGIGASYLTDNTTPRLPGFDGVANGDLTSTDNWLNINAAGFSGSNTSPAAEFAVSHSNNSTHYAQIQNGNDFIIKVQGYDQFSFGGRENGTGSGKQFVVTINGVKQTISHSTTDWNIWRFDLNPATEYIIMVSGDGSNANRFRAFSLRLPEVTKYDVAFAGGDYGTGSMITLKYKEGATVTAPACGFASSDATKEFDKWGVTGVAGTTEVAVDGTFAMPAGNVTLTALWKDKAISSDATLSDLTVGGVTVEGFAAATEVYNVVLPFGTTVVPTVAGTANDANAKSVVVTQASSVTSSATVVVTAENDATKTYTINFSVATSKDILLVFKTGSTACVGSPSTSTQIKSDNAAVSIYINPITFTNVEGTGDNGAEGSSLNVGKKAGNMFTLTAKAGYAFSAMSFLAKIQDANCEYSLNGADWTTLTSTNTDGDECYAPFATGEVHEFRLRSTGASGVWIRNMQLTMIEACTPITLAWDEEPVEFEVGKAGQVIAATANNGGTVTYSSNAPSVIDVNASTGALTVSALGSATLSASTPEGDGTTYCENGGSPIVINKVVKTYYLIQFDPQNETSVSEVKYFSGDAAIALPSDPSYVGHSFQGWFDAPTGGNAVTSAVTPTASVTLYAQWTADCAGPSITTHPASANYLTGRVAAALVCEAAAGNGGALTYTWYSCDDDARTNPVELAGAPTPSTAAAGTFYYFCAITEEGCAVIANSDVATITVTDKDAICLIKVATTGGTNKTVTGLYAGDGDVNLSSSKKMDTDKYIGFTLDGTTLQAGDRINVHTTTAANTEGSHIIFYDNMTDKNELYETGEIGGTGDNIFTINAAMVGHASAYVYRSSSDNAHKWNGYVDYIEVTRACAPILKSVTVAGVEGKPVSNVVTIEVAASTTQSQLEAIAYDWVSNSDAWTAAHNPVAANAWEFGVANTVTLTDKDGDASVYTVTISKAVPSTDATLSALSASAGTLAPAFDPAVLSYTVALPYGTSEVPTLSATKNHIGAAEPDIANAASFTNRQAVSTVTVTAEDGTTELTYTVTFQVERFESTVIWDGSTMSAVAESPASGFTWAVTGFSSVSNYNATCGAKAYTKCLPSGGSASASRNIALNVPEGYLAKFYVVFGTHSDGENRGMFIGSTATKTLDESSVLTLYSSSRTNLTAGTSEMVLGEGTWYINPMLSVDFYEISATLMPVGYQRNVTEGRMGTVCLPANVEAGYIYGAEVYTLLCWKYGTSYADCQMVDFGEVEEMQAGYPYMIIPTSDKFAVVYGDESYDGDGVHMANGFIGTINAIAAAPDNVLVGKYGIINNMVQKLGTNCNSPANRAYIDLSETPSKEAYEAAHPNPAPRKRVSLGHQGTQETTGLDEINVNTEKIEKVMVDGQMFIIRGGHIFDATGRLVK